KLGCTCIARRDFLVRPRTKCGGGGPPEGRWRGHAARKIVVGVAAPRGLRPSHRADARSPLPAARGGMESGTRRARRDSFVRPLTKCGGGGPPEGRWRGHAARKIVVGVAAPRGLRPSHRADARSPLPAARGGMESGRAGREWIRLSVPARSAGEG